MAKIVPLAETEWVAGLVWHGLGLCYCSGVMRWRGPWKVAKIVHLAETENILLKVIEIKLKGSWNNTVKFINSTKKYNRTRNNIKNKLNSN